MPEENEEHNSEVPLELVDEGNPHPSERLRSPAQEPNLGEEVLISEP